jgi:hypothetical protein
MARIIETQLGLDAERAVEHARAPGAALSHMVACEAAQAVTPHPVGAGIADMQNMRDATAQHQRGEGASHAGERGIMAPLAVDPAVERAQNLGRGAPHFEGLGEIAESVEKAAHRHLGGDATAFGATDPVGDCRHHVASRLRQLAAEDGAGEILVARTRSRLGREADAGLDGGGTLTHRRCSDAAS